MNFTTVTTNDVSLDATASLFETGSKVVYLLDDDCGYVLDMEAFLPDSHEAYAKARAAVDLMSDIALDLPMVSSGDIVIVEAAPVVSSDANDAEHGFIVDQEWMSTVASVEHLACDLAQGDSVAACFEAPVAPTRHWRIHLALNTAPFYAHPILSGE